LALLPALQHVKLKYTVFAATPFVPQAAQLLAVGTAEAWGLILLSSEAASRHQLQQPGLL
jgi:hypothetical protein